MLIKDVFNPAEVRDDHIDGQHGICRFSVVVTGYHGIPFGCVEPGYRDILYDRMMEDVNKLPLRPEKVFMYEKEVLLDFVPPYDLVVTSVEVYKAIWENLAEYMDTCLPNLDGRISTCSFGDDPAKVYNEKGILFNQVLGITVSAGKITVPRLQSGGVIKVCDIRLDCR